MIDGAVTAGVGAGVVGVWARVVCAARRMAEAMIAARCVVGQGAVRLGVIGCVTASSCGWKRSDRRVDDTRFSVVGAACRRVLEKLLWDRSAWTASRCGPSLGLGWGLVVCGLLGTRSAAVMSTQP